MSQLIVRVVDIVGVRGRIKRAWGDDPIERRPE